MLGHGGSPDVGRLAAEAAEEVGGSQFFEADFANPLESLEHYCRSSLGFQRLAYAQGIAAAAVTADYPDCVEVLLPLVEHLTRDDEPEIRHVAVQQLRGLGAALHSKDAERSLRDIEASLLVCAQQCALDDEEEVAKAAILAFEELVQLLPAARATAASKRAVDRLEARASDDGTLAAVRLLSHTASTWTPEALRRHVPRYINRWTNHRDFSVREAVGTTMSLVVSSMPLRLCHTLLLPLFYQLCRDSNWRVRRACSADLPRLAQAMQQHQQQQQQQQQQQLRSHQCQDQQIRQSPVAQPNASSRSNFSSVNNTSKHEGGCCAKTSSCLRTVRFSADLASISTGSLQSLSNGVTGFQRNRSASAVNLPLQPATTEQISAKHPMHSSFIREGLLSSAASPNSSAPPSPTGRQAASMEDGKQPNEQTSPQHACNGLEAAAVQSDCELEATAPMLHDCWCALRQCMELLSADTSHWVKVAALSGLGPLLLVLPSCQIGMLLLGRFTGMAGSSVVIYEISVALSCAQHFGPLVVRLGAARWHDMRDAWQSLQMSRDPAVLCELLKSVPSLVSALGPAITCQELMPALAMLLQSHLGWIAGELVSVMGELMETLPPSGQELLLKVLDQLASATGERSRSWRLRRDLALQLGRVAAAAGPDAVTDSVWPVAMALCCDPVSSVRVAAASQIGPLLAVLPASLLSQHRPCHTGDQMLSMNGADATTACDVQRCVVRSSSGRKHHAVCKPHHGLPQAAADEDKNDNDTSSGGGSDSSQASCNSKHTSSTVDQGTENAQSIPADAPLVQMTGATCHNSSSAGSHMVQTAKEVPSSWGGAVREVSFGDSCRSNERKQYSVLTDFELDLPCALAPADAFSGQAEEEEGTNSDEGLHQEIVFADGSPRNSSSNSSVSDCCSGRDDGAAESSGSDSDTDSALVDRTSQKQVSESSNISNKPPAQYSAVMHPALQYQLPPLPSGATQPELQQQQEPDIYNIRRTVVVCPVDAVVSSALPAEANIEQQEQGPEEQEQQQQQQSMTPAAVHPAMMPVGHPAMMPLSRSTPPSQPRAVPVPSQRGSSSNTPQPSAGYQLSGTPTLTTPGTLKAKSTGDLLKSDTTTQQQRKRCSSNPSIAGHQQPSAAPLDVGGKLSLQRNGLESDLPEPAVAAPHQYVACVLAYFGCSSHHQQRQLFVPLVMGILAACHDKVTCEQTAQLLDRLEALASDEVTGVRYAVASALQQLRHHAQVVMGLHEQQLQPSANGILTKESEQSNNADGTGSCKPSQQQDATEVLSSSSASLDSYTSYVRQLASRSGANVVSGGNRDSAGSASQGVSVSSSEDSTVKKVCGPNCAVCEILPGNADNLELLKKLCSCQQLERLMGVVALTTGPL